MYIITLNEMHIRWSDCWVAGHNSLRNTNQPVTPLSAPPSSVCPHVGNYVRAHPLTHTPTYRVLLIIV